MSRMLTSRGSKTKSMLASLFHQHRSKKRRRNVHTSASISIQRWKFWKITRVQRTLPKTASERQDVHHGTSSYPTRFLSFSFRFRIDSISKHELHHVSDTWDARCTIVSRKTKESQLFAVRFLSLLETNIMQSNQSKMDVERKDSQTLP